MITISDFIYKTCLNEMPYITLDDGETVDLELEVHNKMNGDEFITYLKSWLNGDVIHSKTPGFDMHIDKNTISEFANKLLHNYFFKFFIHKHYGQKVWEDIKLILSEYS